MIYRLWLIIVMIVFSSCRNEALFNQYNSLPMAWHKDSTIKFTGNVKQLLKQLNINEETVLVIKDNQVLTTDIQLEDKDTIQILSVISGG